MAFGKKNVDSNIISDISQITELKDIREQLIFYVKENERLVNELRNSRHNTFNILNGINGYIELQDWDGLKKYFYDILERSRKMSDTNISSIEKILNPSLKRLLEVKLNKAENAGVDIKVMIDERILIEESLISETDLNKVINGFLDNAIEAASAASRKKVSIYIFDNEKSTSIVIENTFKERPDISPKMIGTTRSEYGESGIQPAGIILSNYSNVLNNTFIQHNVFVQELQIIK